MSQNKIPENNPAIEHEIWQQLLRASVDKHHEWRSPVLVTNGAADNKQTNWPEARTVILRAVDMHKKQLTFYTDSRSPKVTQLLARPKAVLVFWSKRLNWQLRIKVIIDIKIEGELVQKTWAKLKQSPAAGDYLSAQAPGEILTNLQDLSSQNLQNQNLHNLQNHAYFAILVANVIDIDWLALGRNGHQRAKIDADGFHYLVP